MASFLEGQLAKALNKGFKGQSLKGVLHRPTVATSGGLKPNGDPVLGTPLTYPCLGFIDAYSAYSRATAGIPDTDLKVCIFAASLPAGIGPQKDDQVSLTRNGITTWYQLRREDTDPATALWTCQGYVVPAPAP